MSYGLTVWVTVDLEDGTVWGDVALSEAEALASARAHVAAVMPSAELDDLDGVHRAYSYRIEVATRADAIAALQPLWPERSRPDVETDHEAGARLVLEAERLGLVRRPPPAVQEGSRAD